MEEIYQLKLDTDKETPMYRQIADGIAMLIEKGILPTESKLPPIRKLAAHYGVNTVTIVTAYKYLEQKHMVYSRVGSGTYIAPLPIAHMPTPLAQRNLVNFTAPSAAEHTINFTLTSLPPTLFPVHAFKEAFDTVLEREQGGAFRYTDSMGYLPLRDTLCRYLASFGIQTNAEQVQIISGAQQGIDIMAKAFLQYGDVVFTESPTFYGAAGAFLSRGAKVLGIPLQQDGMDLLALENDLKLYHPRFVYMTAYFQTPTGISYSMEKKRRLLELAEQYDTYIIEEDNFYDFHYSKEKPLPLKALDHKNRVVYIKSFSKILMPGLRMGVMVLPKRIRNAVLEAKYTTDISSSGFIQKALEEYLCANGWERHGEQVRRYGSGKYRQAVSMAKKYLCPPASCVMPQGGVSLWVTLPEGVTDEALCSHALTKHVLVSPGSQFSLEDAPSHQIRLSFASLTDDQIAVGMKRLGESIRELMQQA